MKSFGGTEGGGASKKQWGRKHDVILFYSRSSRWTFNVDLVREKHKWDKGQLRADGSERDLSKGKLPDDVFRLHGVMPWAKERTGYPTQKPLALLERIITASSGEGDLVLDPFCGCATALVAADMLKRKWVGVDLSSRAVDLVKMRLDQMLGSLYRPNMITAREDIPIRTDLGELPNYRTHKHTLYGKQEGICAGCMRHFLFRNLTLDHILAKSNGGSDHIDNLQLLCGACNSMKGTMLQETFIAKLKKRGIRS